MKRLIQKFLYLVLLSAGANIGCTISLLLITPPDRLFVSASKDMSDRYDKNHDVTWQQYDLFGVRELVLSPGRTVIYRNRMPFLELGTSEEGGSPVMIVPLEMQLPEWVRAPSDWRRNEKVTIRNYGWPVGWWIIMGSCDRSEANRTWIVSWSGRNMLLGQVVWMSVMLTIIVGTCGIRRIARIRRGGCAKCGYNLRCNQNRGCPECGWGR